MHRRQFNRALLGIVAPTTLARAQAQGRRQASIVVPYTPGGSTDLLGRLYADAFSAKTNEKYIVENRPGANGMLGVSQVTSAPADGRTLLYGYGNLLLNQEFLMKELRVSPLEALVPVARACMIQAVIVCGAQFPAANLREFLTMARRNPGRHSYAYYGDLGIASLAAEAGLKLLRVPYRGGLPGMVDVMAGTVDIITSSLTQALPMIRAGRLKVLAVSGEDRIAEWPEVTTIREVLPEYRALDYQVVMAPKGTPPSILQELSERTVAALAAPEVRQAFLERGAIVAPLGPQETLTFMQVDRENIAKVVKLAGIQPE